MTTQEINLPSGNILTLSAKEGNKSAHWNPSGNHYKVTVRLNGKRFSFDFWDSIANTRENKPCDLRGAVACWAMDVNTGLDSDSAADVASEFGYDKPSEAMRVFRGVKKAEAQYNKIGMTEEDLQYLADY